MCGTALDADSATHRRVCSGGRADAPRDPRYGSPSSSDYLNEDPVCSRGSGRARRREAHPPYSGPYSPRSSDSDPARETVRVPTRAPVTSDSAGDTLGAPASRRPPGGSQASRQAPHRRSPRECLHTQHTHTLQDCVCVYSILLSRGGVSDSSDSSLVFV